MIESAAYPAGAAARDRWIRERRGPRNPLDPWKPYASLWEEEPGADGRLLPTATLFLTNRECPFRCLMCDLWRNTLEEEAPRGAIPAQIRSALERLPGAAQVKLYNAGSFFDPRAIPEADYEEIAELIGGFERVIVECHPAFLGGRALRIRDLIGGRLEVAIGLETANPEVLERLNKRMTLDSFRAAARFVKANGMDLRVFILVRPPFLTESEAVFWAERSLDFAFQCGTDVCTLIPTRAGNGAMERLQSVGEFEPPRMSSLEAAQEYGLRLSRGRVFSDLWDVERFFACGCSEARAERMAEMNRMQRIPPPVVCDQCAP